MAHHVKALLKLPLSIGFITLVCGCAASYTTGNYDPQERARIYKAECISQQKSIQSHNVVFHHIDDKDDKDDKENSKYTEGTVTANDVFGPSDVERTHCGN